MVANYILLVFEGQKTEPNILNSLQRFYVDAPGRTIVKGVYGGEIYSLYHKIAKDSDLDLFLLLKEREENKIALDGVSKDDVSEIYLFFDYDGHAPTADDGKMKEMLAMFCEETEMGRLYVSYPMVEAIRHLRDDVPFKNTTAKCKAKIGYKRISHDEGDPVYQDMSRLGIDHWNKIIGENCKKLNYLMVGSFTFPEKYFDQQQIFARQLERHITPNEEVAVLSAFPIFVLDYYGCAKMAAMLNKAYQNGSDEPMAEALA